MVVGFPLHLLQPFPSISYVHFRWSQYFLPGSISQFGHTRVLVERLQATSPCHYTSWRLISGPYIVFVSVTLTRHRPPCNLYFGHKTGHCCLLFHTKFLRTLFWLDSLVASYTFYFLCRRINSDSGFLTIYGASEDWCGWQWCRAVRRQ